MTKDKRNHPFSAITSEVGIAIHISVAFFSLATYSHVTEASSLEIPDFSVEDIRQEIEESNAQERKLEQLLSELDDRYDETIRAVRETTSEEEKLQLWQSFFESFPSSLNSSSRGQQVKRNAEKAIVKLAFTIVLKEDQDQWELWQESMASAFAEVEEITETETKDRILYRKAWERFLEVYSEENPHSERDNQLRKEANRRKEGLAETVVSSVHEPTDSEAEFLLVYADYEKAAKSGNREQAEVAAARAWQLCIKLFGESDVRTANMSIKYAAALYKHNGESRKPQKIVKSAIRNLENIYGEESFHLVDPYITLAKVSSSRIARRTNLREAARLASDHGEPAQSGRINLEIGIYLLTYDVNQAEKYLERAYEIYENNFGPDDYQSALSRVYLANLAVNRRDWEKAIEYLNASIKVFEADEATREQENIARGLIVKAYEELGLSDSATHHLLIIGSKSESVGDYLPLFKVSPVFPESALRKRKTGYVILEFEVDKRGFTQNISVVESSYKGFEKPSIEAAAKFRYAPSFRDGKAVRTVGVQNKINFSIVRNSR